MSDRDAVFANVNRVDRLCDDFAKQLANGKQPSIEEFLGHSTGFERELLRELLLIEIEHSLSQGKPPVVADYLPRFPDQRSLVHEVFEQNTDLRERCLSQAVPSTISARVPSNCDTDLPILANAKHRALAHPAVIGPYSIVDEIGRGGMGVVLKGRHKQLGRLAAIKMPLVDTIGTEEVRDRFLREGRAAANLSHPNICTVFEVGECDGCPYIAMEYVTGDTLGEWLGANRSSGRASAEIVAKLARAVSYAHEHRVIHRDIKPSNVMVDAVTQEPVLMDFGLAHQEIDADSKLTRNGQIMGTPAYMAPEQASGQVEAVGPLSDVYGLGGVLYYLLCGEPPFKGRSGEVLQKVQTDEPKAPRRRNSKIHRDLETICLKALAKRPADRYQFAAEVADDLERFCSGEAILAKRDPLTRKFVREVRRHPMAASALLLCLIAIVVAGVFAVGASSAHRANRLISDLQIELSSPEWRASDVSRFDETVKSIRSINVSLGDEQQARLDQGIADRVQTIIHQPRLRDGDLKVAEDLIQLLVTRRPGIAEHLKSDLANRLSSLDLVAELTPPFTELRNAIKSAPDAVAITEHGTLVRARAGDAAVYTDVSGAGHSSLTVKVANWTKVGQFGVLIDGAPGTDAYTFEVTGSDVFLDGTAIDERLGKEPLSQAASSGRYLDVRIRRGDQVLKRTYLDSRELDLSSLTIRAEQDGDRLSMQIDELPVLEVVDPFLLIQAPEARFGFLWPQRLEIAQARMYRHLRPQEPSQLESGDALFNGGQFTEALEMYDQQVRKARDQAIRQEARFKAALCHLRLNRPREATKAFAKVFSEEGGKWPAIAGCYYWMYLVDDNQSREANQVFDLLVSRFPIEQLAVMMPDDFCQKMRLALGEAIVVLASLNRQPIERLERLLNPHGAIGMRFIDQISTMHLLAQAYLIIGDRQEAQRICLSALEKIPPRGPDPLKLSPRVVFYARMFCQHFGQAKRDLGEPRDALKVIEDYIGEDLDEVNGDPVLLLERARLLAATGDYKAALNCVERFHEFEPESSYRYSDIVESALIEGFLREELRNSQDAKEAWKRGTFPVWLASDGKKDVTADGLGEYLKANPGAAVELSIIASLSDNPLTEKQAGAFIDAGASTLAGADSPFRGLLGPEMRPKLIPNATVRTILREMWLRSRGKQLAQRIAFRSLPIRERVNAPLVLFAYELFRQQAVQGELKQEQDQQTWEVAELLYTKLLSKELSAMQMMQLGLTWKGFVNSLSWEPLARSLKGDVKAPLAWLLGHRFLVLGRKADAANFFSVAIEHANPDSPLHQLSRQHLDQMEAN